VGQPVLLLRGEQGSGKSSAARVLIGLLDPARGGLAAPPRDLRDWSVMAAGRTVVGLDNLSTIPMWLSDGFCWAVTGDEVAVRQLYSDDALVVLPIQCAMVITSIDPGEIRGDLADRLMPVQLEPIGGARLRETDILKRLDDVKEPLLGAALDQLVLVLRGLSAVAAPEQGWPRMADFAGVLAALDDEGGGNRLGAYLGVASDNEADLLAGDPVVDGLTELLEAFGGFWSGSATTLLETLTARRDFTREQTRHWSTAKLLSGYLRRLQPSLRSAGIEMDFGKSGSTRSISVRRQDLER